MKPEEKNFFIYAWKSLLKKSPNKKKKNKKNRNGVKLFASFLLEQVIIQSFIIAYCRYIVLLPV
jgi:type I restriction-modification system DNA methylase subunit